jgi:protein-tyrosine phosphatase
MFSWLTPQLALGGRLEHEAAVLARHHRIAAVIDLRDETCDNATVLRTHGIELLHLPTRDRCGVALDMLSRGVAFAREYFATAQRVLIHCEHGVGRSAVLALCVLVEGGLPPIDALALAKHRRAVVSPSPEQYESWAAWLRATNRQPPPFDDFAAIAYRHLRAG